MSESIEDAQTDEPGADRPTDPAATVLLLGSGELSRELALAFQRLGGVVVAADRYYAPAHGVADRSAVIKMNDAEELAALIEREKPRYVVAESGVIAADALVAVAERATSRCCPRRAASGSARTAKVCAGSHRTSWACPRCRSGSPGRSRN